jgi:uncharacterized protein YkwD/precorrin-6B methylase 2
MTRFWPIGLLFGALVLAAVPADAQEKSVKPGINAPFKDPDLKKYIATFEGESREIFSQRKEIVAACKIKPGMVVADVGAGTGLFTRLFAAEVGAKGKVFAVDIAPAFIEHIRKTCKEAGITNVEAVRCGERSVDLPAASVDLVFICDTYHHFEYPMSTMASIHQALKPGGQLVLIDFHRIEGKSSGFVMVHVRAGQEVFTKEIEAAGFRVLGTEQLLKENYFVRFEKGGKSDDTDKVRAALHKAINDLRGEAKVEPLARNAMLDVVAQKHADNMAKQDKYGDDNKNGHVLDGKTFKDRLDDAGYPYASANENVSWVQVPSSKKAVVDTVVPAILKSWKNTPDSYKAILSTDFTETGIGVAQSKSGKWYVCQVFGTPKK